MSFNTQLGFMFQNSLIKRLKDSAGKDQYLKILDVKHCNINPQNMNFISQLIQRKEL